MTRVQTFVDDSQLRLFKRLPSSFPRRLIEASRGDKVKENGRKRKEN